LAFTFRAAAPQILQGVALIAALAGVLFWSSLLLTSAESNAPLAARPDALARVATPALQWFSNQPVTMDIKVSGVMVGAQGALAIISINDAPPRGFLTGERLANGVRLLAIEEAAVIVERGAQQSRFNVSTLPEPPTLPALTRP